MASLEEILGLSLPNTPVDQSFEPEYDPLLSFLDIPQSPSFNAPATVDYESVRSRLATETELARQQGVVPEFTDRTPTGNDPLGTIFLSDEDKAALSPGSIDDTTNRIEMPTFKSDTKDPVALAEDYELYTAQFEAAVGSKIRALREADEPFDLKLAKEVAGYARDIGGTQSDSYIKQARAIAIADQEFEKQLQRKAQSVFAEDFLAMKQQKIKLERLKKEAQIAQQLELQGQNRINVAAEITGKSPEIDTVLRDLGEDPGIVKVGVTKGVGDAAEKFTFAKDVAAGDVKTPTHYLANGQEVAADLAFKHIADTIPEAPEIKKLITDTYNAAKINAEASFLKANKGRIQADPKFLATAKAPGGSLTSAVNKVFNQELQKQSNGLAAAGIFETVTEGFIKQNAPIAQADVIMTVMDKAKDKVNETPLQAIKSAIVESAKELQEAARSRGEITDPTIQTNILNVMQTFLTTSYTKNFNRTYGRAGIAVDPLALSSQLEFSIGERLFGTRSLFGGNNGQ